MWFYEAIVRGIWRQVAGFTEETRPLAKSLQGAHMNRVHLLHGETDVYFIRIEREDIDSSPLEHLSISLKVK